VEVFSDEDAEDLPEKIPSDSAAALLLIVRGPSRRGAATPAARP
jgi:hypothetical protein